MQVGESAGTHPGQSRQTPRPHNPLEWYSLAQSAAGGDDTGCGQIEEHNKCKSVTPSGIIPGSWCPRIPYCAQMHVQFALGGQPGPDDGDAESGCS